MSANDKKTITGGVTIGNLLSVSLTILFITLKLIGKITWSWVWVVSPLWIPWAVFILAIVALFILGRSK